MKQEPSMDAWLKEAKQSPEAAQIGMYLTHNGVVRQTARATVRPEEMPNDENAGKAVASVSFSYEQAQLDKAIEEARTWEGVHYVRVWLNEGTVAVGGSLMYVLIGADIRPHAVDALIRLVGNIKTNIVKEEEIYE